MKKLLKSLSLVLALVLAISVFAACGGEKTVKTGTGFTYWVQLPSATGESLQSFNELMMYQEISKATGTAVEFLHPAAGSTGSEAFQILLSSGDYPDMIEYGWRSYAGGPDQAIDDGVIIAINDYLEDYAPNYYSYVEGEKNSQNGGLYKAQAITAKGNYYGFSNLSIGNIRGFSGLFVRADMLDKWGLDVPVTIDDWDKLFEKAKAEGIERPLTGTKGFVGAYASDIFNGAYKVGNNYYVDDKGNFKFGPFQKEYKEYLKKLTEWFSKGYVDKDYVTNDTTMLEGYIANGTSIAAHGWIGGQLGKLIPAMAERNPDFRLVACPYPVLKEGEKSWFQELGNEAADPTIAISVQCGAENEDRYKEAMKWCDYIYGEEGMLLKTFGIEGDTYTVETDENGEKHYIYTDKIFDHEKLGLHSVSAALYHFFRPANGPGLSQHPDYLNGYYPYEEQKEAVVVWNQFVDEAKIHTVPWSVSFTSEEAAKKAEIESRGKSKFSAAISNIILGKASLDTFDAAIEEAKKDGFDELTKIYKAAYDRYLAAAKN